MGQTKVLPTPFPNLQSRVFLKINFKIRDFLKANKINIFKIKNYIIFWSLNPFDDMISATAHEEVT